MEAQIPLVNRIDSIHQVSAHEWNACVGAEHPFLSHEFFACMEDSGTACPESGWQPCHLLFRRDGQLRGVAPLVGREANFTIYDEDDSLAALKRVMEG